MKKILSTLMLLLLIGCDSHIHSLSPVAPATADSNNTTHTAFDMFIVVGDSIMIGAPPNATTSALLLNEENRPTTNISRGGQTMRGAHSNQVSGTINYLTDHGRATDDIAVIVELGHNDWFLSFGLENFYTEYVALLTEIKDEGGKNVHVFCVEPIASLWDHIEIGHTNSLGEPYQQVRDTVKAVASTGLCTLIETFDWFTYEDVNNPGIFPDGLHILAPGHRIYKDRLMERLNSVDISPNQ